MSIGVALLVTDPVGDRCPLQEAKLALGKMAPWLNLYSPSPPVSAAAAGRGRRAGAQSDGEMEQPGAPGRHDCCHAGARQVDWSRPHSTPMRAQPSSA